MKKLVGLKSGMSGILFLSAIFMILNNCSKSSYEGNEYGNTPSVSETNKVFVQSGKFMPFELHVSPGTTVTWVNNDAAGYSITCDALNFSTILVGYGSFSYTFMSPGTYIYRSNYLGTDYSEMKAYVN